MQRIVIPFLAACLLVASGCGGESPDSTASIEERDNRSTVSVLTMEPTEFIHQFAVQGNVETDRNATLTAEFSGIIDELLVREGQRVNAGQALMRINTDMLDATQAELETQLALATELFERQARLWSQGIGSEVDYLQLKASKDALEKSLSTLSEQRDMATVRAPFSGIFDRAFTKQGELAAPGIPLARVVDLDGMYIRAMVSDHYAGRIEAGMPARVEVTGMEVVETEIARVGSYINPSNRTIEITLGLPGKSGFLPNMFANVWLQDLALDSALVLPNALVQQDVSGNNFVYIIQGETASKRIVELGMSSENQVLITAGLNFGDRVVEKGASRIVDGEAVRTL